MVSALEGFYCNGLSLFVQYVVYIITHISSRCSFIEEVMIDKHYWFSDLDDLSDMIING